MKQSNFLRRLKYYGIGFGLGLVFLVFFFNNRGCSWTPDNRVKSAVLRRVIVMPDNQKADFEKASVDSKVVLDYLENGQVVFSESDKNGPNKRYKIEWGDRPELYFTLPEQSFISAVYLNPPSDVDTRTGKARMVHFPEIEDGLVYIDSALQESCEMKTLNWTDGKSITDLLKKKAKIDFDQSNFNEVVKPMHLLEVYLTDEETVRLESIWYKEKINITAILLSDTSACK